ncbi:MAG TPA: hypothetical protein VF755_11145 [Catenuloplanes sp.]
MSSTDRVRPSHDDVPPDDVTDPLLWRLAIDVAAAHQPGDDGRCRNLQCVGHRGPCAASVTAKRAMRLARATPPAQAADQPVTAAPVARGRACVPTNTYRPSTGWFSSAVPAQQPNDSIGGHPARTPHRPPAVLVAA